MKTFNEGRKTQKGLFIQMKVIEGTGEIWHSINTTRIKFEIWVKYCTHLIVGVQGGNEKTFGIGSNSMVVIG